MVVSSEPQVVLPWLLRLRFLAAAGQVGAVLVAVYLLHLPLPVRPIFLVIAITFVSNMALWPFRLSWRLPAVVLPLIVVLDVLLLTALLMLSGGAENPFAILFLIHVAMAVVILPMAWVWAIALLAMLSYGLLFVVAEPLGVPGDVPLIAGRWMAMSLVGVLIAYFVGRVVTSLRERERELLAIRERAARSELLASLTTLAAGAAHELGTPLGTVAIAAREIEVAAGRIPEAGDMAEDARLIRQEVNRCRTILDRMRVDVAGDLRRGGDGPVPVVDLVRQLREDFSEADFGRVVVKTVGETAKLPTRAWRQAAVTMLRNALDATVESSGKPVQLLIEAGDGKTRFVVTDMGPGMALEVARRAGEPFYTTKEVGKGMGLGLFLVRLVAEQCGGRFALESTVGVGTTVILELPESSVQT